MLTPVSRLWNRFGATFERTDIAPIGDPYEVTRSEDDIVRRTTTRYASLRQAVERRLQGFLRQDVVSHLEIGCDEIFLLHYIEVTADGLGAPTLEQFLHEFSPESRVQWVKRLLGPAVGRHVSVDQFLGLDREFSVAELSETDPFEEKLNQAANPLYRVILHGRWESAARSTPPVASVAEASAPTVRAAGPALRLSIRDARSGSGTRALEIEHFPAVLGSSVHADVEISGYYVSTRHCTLHWDGHQVSVTDHSTNGTWVDGERVPRDKRVALVDGAQLGFGRDKGTGDHDRFPVISAELARSASMPAERAATPVAPPLSTPVAPGIATAPAPRAGREQRPLAVLGIADASGSPRRDVLTLPFSIGRGSAQDYIIPEANQGVSCEHLVIEEINRSGAVTLNRAVSRNGTFAGSRALPERFLWRFGEEIVLGEKWADAPAVRISLLPLEDTP